jgi:hypothetical protein
MVVPTEVLAAQNPIPWLGAPLEASISGLGKAELKMGQAALGAHESQEGALTESREQNLSVSDEDQNTVRFGTGLRDSVATGQDDYAIETSMGNSTLALISVDVRSASSGKSLTVDVTKGDWSAMQDLGLGTHPDLVVGLALRRQAGPSRGQSYNPMPTIRLVTHDAQEIPKDTWPASWEGLVEHVQQGGYFRRIATLRGGMDQDAQNLLDGIDFNTPLAWEEIDQLLVRIRTGVPIPAEEITYNVRLAQALVGCVALQQWDALSAFLGSLPQVGLTGTVLTPARLAALSVIISRPRPEPQPPPQWLLSATFSELRFNHLSLRDFGLDPHQTNDLRGQLQDEIVNRILRVAPAIIDHPHFRLQNLRSDLRVEINLRDQEIATSLFSASVVLPAGDWITAFFKGTLSLGEHSFCTIVPSGMYVETEFSNIDRQVLRAIRTALGADNSAFRALLDESLSRAFHCVARSRDATVRFTSNGKGGKRTMEHVPPDSPDSRLLIALDGTKLLMARRNMTRMALQLGPVTVGFMIPQCPQQAQRSMLQPREPATIRQRMPGGMIDCPILLVGPLPKGALSEPITNSGSSMADIRRQIHNVCSQ